MVIAEIMMCLLVFVVMKIIEDRNIVKNRRESNRTLCPSGLAIEYEACRKAQEEVKEYIIKYGIEEANEHYAQYAGKFVKDPICNYVRVKGRLAAIEQNKAPKCYCGPSGYNLNSSYDSVDVFSFGGSGSVISMYGMIEEYSDVMYQYYLEKDELSMRHVENILSQNGMTFADLPNRFTSFHTTKHQYDLTKREMLL